MKRITLTGHNTGATMVSNAFIDEYMINANEVQIKIYLHLLRCAPNDIPVSVSSIADLFNYSEKDVLRALSYWERMSVLDLEYDNASNVVGIAINSCNSLSMSSSKQTAEPVSAPVASQAATPIMQAQPSTAATTQPSTATTTQPNGATTTSFYSLEQIKAFKDSQGISQMLFMTEYLMGKPLSPADMNTLMYIYDGLGFSAELMEYLVEYCINGNNKSMRYIEKVAISWADKGISTVEQAKAEGSNSRRNECYQVLREFGITNRDIVVSDMEYLNRWFDDYNMSMELIKEAIKRTLLSISNPSFKYCDSILKRWNADNVHKLSDIEASDMNHKYTKADDYPYKSSQTKFHNFAERNDNFNAIANQLLKTQVPLSN